MSVQFESFPIAKQARPKLNAIDVWLLDVSAMPMMVAQGQADSPPMSSLNTTSRDRRIRQQFFLRLLLASYLDRPGKDISLRKDSNGKPQIADESLTFNISHSQQWLAVAIGDQQAIGIDIEIDRPIRRADALAKRCFSAEEAHAIEQLEEPERSCVFLKRWTKTEALVKAQGEKLAMALGDIRFSCPNQTLMACPKHWVSPVNWAIMPLALDTPLIGAVASPEPVLDVRIKQIDWGQMTGR